MRVIISSGVTVNIYILPISNVQVYLNGKEPIIRGHVICASIKKNGTHRPDSFFCDKMNFHGIGD